MQDLRTPPGPRLPGAVQTALVWRDPRGTVARWHERYGPVVRARVAPQGRVLYVADADVVAELLARDREDFLAGAANASFGDVLGPRSVFVEDGDAHRTGRRAMTPAFGVRAVRAQGDEIARIAREVLSGWPEGRPFAVHPSMQDLAFAVIMGRVLGLAPGTRRTALEASIRELLTVGSLFEIAPAPRLAARVGPWARRRRAVRARVDALLREQIAEHRAEPGVRGDLLDLMLTATDGTGAEGALLDDDALCDQLVTMVLAGHETTATALAWTMERLVRHPAVLERTRQAVDDGDDRWLDAVVKESLRVRPVSPEIGRTAVSDCALGGWRVPRGTVVVPSLDVLQRASRRCARPDSFEPERFLDGGVDPWAWLPFGGGSRRCLGAVLAQTEMRIVLREILSRFEPATTTAPDEAVVPRHVTLVPARGGVVSVRRRPQRP